ncbi:unnamed protein product [Boreogadus saida]
MGSAGITLTQKKSQNGRHIVRRCRLLILLNILPISGPPLSPDDGKLSLDEFRAYFSDGVLTAEELRVLFHTIDTHNTDNVDTDELCEYFSQHLGEYENVLGALEDLNMSILKAMDKTKKWPLHQALWYLNDVDVSGPLSHFYLHLSS